MSSVTLRSKIAQPADLEASAPSYYTIEYVTVSSRGTKVYLCKYSIAQRKLYVLQAQANADAFDSDEAVRDSLRAVVSSFAVST